MSCDYEVTNKNVRFGWEKTSAIQLSNLIGRLSFNINTSFFSIVFAVETSLHKPPKVADEFTVPKTALKGEKFVLECIVYGK